MEIEKEYYSLIEASKKFNCEEFDLIYLGAFKNLPIYIYVHDIQIEYEEFVKEDEDTGLPNFQFIGNKLFHTGYL
ncbi:MAG: hypothetical protein P8N23_01205 [Methylophilaceae bacterium]|nr:hypothetical protein [Methylophilaceae bacterium]